MQAPNAVRKTLLVYGFADRENNKHCWPGRLLSQEINEPCGSKNRSRWRGGRGWHVQLFDVREMGLPMYDPDRDELPSAARELVEAVKEADGMLWSSPLYHGSVSGSFKNAIDWLHLLGDHDPPYLANKIIGLISTAGGVQGLQAVNSMEFIVRALRGWAVPLVLPIPRASQVFDASGHVKDVIVEQQLRLLGREVYRAAQQFAREGECDYAQQGQLS